MYAGETKKNSNMSVEGKRKRGRPKHQWVDTIKLDMEEWKLNSKDIRDRVDGNH